LTRSVSVIEGAIALTRILWGANFAVRNLNGSMDEFAIFKAALTSSEIGDIYRHGKP
jgi:hypothetical protein